MCAVLLFPMCDSFFKSTISVNFCFGYNHPGLIVGQKVATIQKVDVGNQKIKGPSLFCECLITINSNPQFCFSWEFKFLSSFLWLFKKYFLWKVKWEGKNKMGRQRRGCIFHPLIHSLRDHNHQVWARLNRARNFMPPKWVAGARWLKLCSVALLDPLVGSWLRSGAAVTSTLQSAV